jgi:FHS family glucose/mannose:H+ symporter-like MFS transporter
MFTKETKLGLIATFTTLTAFAFSSNAIPPLVTTIAGEFGVRYETFGGYIVMLQFTFFAVASLTGGWAAGRFNLSNRSLIIFGIMLLGVLLMVGAAFPSFTWFIFWAVPLGFCGGLVETFSSIMVCKFGGPQSSKMNNLAQVFFCFGAIIAPAIVAGLLRMAFSWRSAFITLGILIFIFGIWFILQTRNLQEPAWEIEPSPSSREPADTRGPVTHPPLRSDPLLYYLSGALFLYVTIEGSIVVWVATYFEKYLHVQVDSAAWRLSAYWTGMLLGRTLMLFLKGKWTLWPALFCSAAGMLAGTALLSLTWPPAVATGLVFLTGFLSGPLWPVIVMMSQKLRNSTHFTACVIAAGALGAGFGPFFSSYVIKFPLLGLKAFFPVLAAECVLLCAALVKAKFIAADHNHG